PTDIYTLSLHDALPIFKNINQNLIISPPMENMPDLLPMGMARKNIIIKLKDTLKPNTTYSFNFGESIIDNNEGNVLPQFKYVFRSEEHTSELQSRENLV